jgi:hypothetical protein
VIAIPNKAFAPSAEALAQAHVVLSSLTELEPSVVDPDK